MSLIRRLLNREAFLAMLTLSVGGFAGIAVGIPIIGYALTPLIRPSKDVWRDIGSVDKYKDGNTVEVPFQASASEPWAGTTARQAVWLRRNNSNSFTAFALYCTHLGCPVHWLTDAKIFLCPCHGSVFNSDGTVAGGPAPKSLFQYQTRVVNGRVQIKTHSLPVIT